jgi:outer membrane lipoprotein-sorting protein
MNKLVVLLPLSLLAVFVCIAQEAPSSAKAAAGLTIGTSALEDGSIHRSQRSNSL